MNKADTTKKPSVANPPRRFWRTLRRAFFLLLFISLALAAAAYGGKKFLRSPYAHQWVIATIEANTGLRINAPVVQINWWGETTLKRVQMGLPLGHWPILRIQKITLRHNNVLWYAVSGHLGLSAININSPRFIIRRTAQGGWTPALALQALQQAWTQTKLTHRDAKPLSSIILPHITMENGELVAPAFGTNVLKIRHISFTAEARGPLAWHFRLSTPILAHQPWVNIRGTLAPQQQWTHTVQIRGGGLANWLRLFWPQWRGPAQLKANIVGHVTDSMLDEHATHIHLAIGALHVRGRSNIQYAQQHWRINPRSLTFNLAWWPLPIRVFRGSLWADSRGIHGKGIRAELAGGGLHLSGLFNPAMGHIEIQAAWRDISLPGATAQSGTLSGSLLSPWPGQRVITAKITSSGQSPRGLWNTQLNIGAQGSFRHGMTWRLTTPKLLLTQGKNIILNGLNAAGAINARKLTVTHCALPTDPYLKLSGTYDLPLKIWHVHLRCHGNSIPLSNLPADSQVRLRAYGNNGGMQIQNFLVANKTWSLAASGNCIFLGQYPAHLLLTLTGLPVISHTNGKAAPWAVGGVVSGHLLAQGNLLPLHLRLKGRLAGAALRVNSHRLMLPPVLVRGSISRTSINIATKTVRLLGGNITIAAQAGFNGHLASMTIGATNIRAARLATLLLPPTTGKVAGRVALKLRINLPNRDLQKATIHGSLSATHLLWPALWPNTQPISILSATTRINYVRRALLVSPIVVQNSGAGKLLGTVGWNWAHPRHVTLSMSLADWPLTVQSQALTFALNGSAAGSWNVFKQSYRGQAQLKANISKLAFPVGSVRLKINALGRVLAFSSIHATILGNTLRGRGVYSLKDPLASSASLVCNLPDIPVLFPTLRVLHNMRGGFHGTLSAGPTHSTHPLAPMALFLKLNSNGARLGAMNFGAILLHAMISKHSLVINHSSIGLANGTVRPWARLSRHSGGFYSTQLNLHFTDIDLAQITRTVKPRALPVPGLLSGRISVIATPGRWNAAFGQGSIRITNSDLIHTTIMAALYSLLHVQTGTVAAVGHGHATWRLENGNAHITYLHYTDRGASTLATGTISDIWKMPESTISGYVVGTVQPFGNIHIPFVPQTKAILDALESNVSTIEVGGTWQNPKATPVAFKQLDDAIHETFIRAIVGRQHASR